MKTLRVYVKPDNIMNLSKMRTGLAKKHDMSDSSITELDNDPFGTFMTFDVPDTVTPREIKRYRYVREVFDVTDSMIPSLFKAYPAGPVVDSFDDMWRSYGLELKKLGVEKHGWPFRKQRSYMILEGTEGVYAKQIAAYPGISAAKRIDQDIVDIARRIETGKHGMPPMAEGLAVSVVRNYSRENNNLYK